MKYNLLLQKIIMLLLRNFSIFSSFKVNNTEQIIIGFEYIVYAD